MTDKFKVGIAVPTINRPDFIIRLLEFYKLNKSVHPVYIGDSSTDENFNKVSSFLEKTKLPFKVHHYSCKNLNDSEAILYCLDNITEKYSTFSGDDDFHIPSALSQCADYLEANLDYSTCHGAGICFETGEEAKGNLLGMAKYNMGERVEETSLDRVTNFSQNYYVPLFSVHHNAEFRESFRKTIPLPDKGLREVLPNFLSIINGKAKKLNIISVARNTHNQRFILPDYDAIRKKPEWEESFKMLIEFSSNEILRLSSDFNEEQVKTCLEDCLNNYFSNSKLRSQKGKANSEDSFLKSIKRLARLIYPHSWTVKLNSQEREIYKRIRPVIEN